jgi:hypothetical protein
MEVVTKYKSGDRVYVALAVFQGIDIRRAIFRRYRSDDERAGWRKPDDCVIVIDGEERERLFESDFIKLARS